MSTQAATSPISKDGRVAYATVTFDGAKIPSSLLGNRVGDVLDLVGLSDLADDPAGLERALDEAGGSLSGGERQRLGLARVLLSDAPLVLLDEATAHLDAETIALLRAKLAPWLATRTVIEVSHRPGLLTSEARVITLEHGALTEP